MHQTINMQTIITQSSRLGILLLAVAISQGIQAQDPKFSQYFTSPATINPSFIGKGVADVRISGNARSQWWGSSVSPYNTMTAAVEKRIASGRTGKDELGVGLMVLSDGSNNGLLKNNFVGISAAYNKTFDRKGTTQLGLGISMHFANRILDASKFQFQNQFGSMGFQRSLPANDFIVVQKNRYVDVNAGINFSKTTDHWGYLVGVGYFHANRPVEGAYNNTNYPISPRTSLQVQYFKSIGANKKDQLHFTGIADYQGENTVYTAGAICKVGIVGDETLASFNVGAFLRVGDAIYPYVALQANRWLIGFTYDIVTSEVKTAYNSVSSLELSFVWQLSSKRHNEPIKISNILRY